MRIAFAIALATSLAASAAPSAARRVKIGPGELRPVYQPDEDTARIPVDAFWLDESPVTNAQFLSFVKQNPKWRRDRAKALYADPGYLAAWAGPLTLGSSAPPNAPVTRVSWFAARAYCRAQGGRLPTENEWEYAAHSGADEAEQARAIAAWYSRPTPKVLPDVRRGEPNANGVYDLHGLVWEWVDDFANTLVSGDSREAADPDKLKFCGAGAIAATDRTDYAAFMRVAFRSSLQGRYTVANLGFRCAADSNGAVR